VCGGREVCGVLKIGVFILCHMDMDMDMDKLLLRY